MAVNPILYLLTLLYLSPQLLKEAVVVPLEEETKGKKVATISLSRTYTALIDYTC